VRPPQGLGDCVFAGFFGELSALDHLVAKRLVLALCGSLSRIVGRMIDPVVQASRYYGVRFIGIRLQF